MMYDSLAEARLHVAGPSAPRSIASGPMCIASSRDASDMRLQSKATVIFSYPNGQSGRL